MIERHHPAREVTHRGDLEGLLDARKENLFLFFGMQFDERPKIGNRGRELFPLER